MYSKNIYINKRFHIEATYSTTNIINCGSNRKTIQWIYACNSHKTRRKCLAAVICIVVMLTLVVTSKVAQWYQKIYTYTYTYYIHYKLTYNIVFRYNMAYINIHLLIRIYKIYTYV